VKLGYNELGYNEHSVITNKICSPKWPFYYLNQPGYNEQSRSWAVRFNRVWVVFVINYNIKQNVGKDKLGLLEEITKNMQTNLKKCLLFINKLPPQRYEM